MVECEQMTEENKPVGGDQEVLRNRWKELAQRAQKLQEELSRMENEGGHAPDEFKETRDGQ